MEGVAPVLALSTTEHVVVTRAIDVVAVLTVAFFLSRVGRRVLRRVQRAVRRKTPDGPASSRASRRVQTAVSLAEGLWRALVWIVAILVLLSTFGIDLLPVLAGATVVGAALGFGAQSLVRDYLSGFFILVEDQYGIGDTISIGEVTGVVEDLTLRVTRLRALDGRVWYVANGEVRKVANASLQWSRAVVDILVPPGTDVTQATSAISDEAVALSKEPEWSSTCLDPPEVWGVDAVDQRGMTIRVAVKTRALEDARVARVLRSRITARLLREGLLRPDGTS
ncbi:MAG: mechanosensitive ion channel family protein [Acidimicrobiales bacterium]|nr:mechanosensitive ion channel family protein [Acidimicrobiales bacterium]